MKTILIYDQCGERPIEFYILDGDYTHLDGIYVNHSNHDENLRDELANLLYDEQTGDSLLTPETNFPTYEVKKGALVIVAGFLP